LNGSKAKKGKNKIKIGVMESNNRVTIYVHRDTTLGQIGEFQFKKSGYNLRSV